MPTEVIDQAGCVCTVANMRLTLSSHCFFFFNTGMLLNAWGYMIITDLFSLQEVVREVLRGMLRVST